MTTNGTTNISREFAISQIRLHAGDVSPRNALDDRQVSMLIDECSQNDGDQLTVSITTVAIEYLRRARVTVASTAGSSARARAMDKAISQRIAELVREERANPRTVYIEEQTPVDDE